MIKPIKILILGLILILAACKTTNDTTEPETMAYSEQHRPQFHFTPPQQWMNDPNGMVYYDGEYHLFYQHYPDNNVWGPMHWGHAVSKDLVTWEQLPIALYPDSLGLIFSGSAVIDWNNTSGFGKGDKPPMVAIYTYHLMEGEKNGRHDFQTQGIAYSNDNGRTWTKYEGNPVIPNTDDIHDFRDPKVFWHTESEQWVMILAANDKVMLYNSKDLKAWTFASEFGVGHGSQARPWECPDLFELKTEDGDSKWVMIVSIGNRIAEQAPNGGSGTQYFIGDFDGTTFTNEEEESVTRWIDYGRDDYAGVTWSDMPSDDGRRIFIGWMSNWQYALLVPTYAWRSAMTLPRTLELKDTDAGLRLASIPVKETAQLRTDNSFELADETITDSKKIDLGFSPKMLEVVLEAEIGDGANFGIELSNSKGEVYRVGLNTADNQYYSDRTKAGKIDFSEHFAAKVHTAPSNYNTNTVKWHLFFDVASCELFAEDGTTVITDIYFPNEDFDTISFYSESGSTEVKKASFYEMKRIW